MNNFDVIKQVRDDLEKDEEFRKTIEEYNELCTKIYIASLVSSIAKAIAKAIKKIPLN